MAKSVGVGGGRQLEIRWDVFNALNRANFDLPNRIFYREQVKTLLRTDGASFAVLLLDLDHFKGINDTLGYLFGDKLLRLLAGRLRKLAGQGSTVARLGGDEFAILLPRTTAPDRIDAVAGTRSSRIRRMPLAVVARRRSRSPRAASRARVGNRTVATATENTPWGSM